MGNLPEEIRRRCMHVVNEIRRISGIESEMKAGDLSAIAKTFYHSHESLRDLYEVSCPEVDWLVKRVQESEGTCGARMIGDGFGGCVIAFVLPENIDEIRKKMDDYERIFGFHPVVYEMKTATCARIVENTAPQRQAESAAEEKTDESASHE
jgi:galactokinase